MEQPRPEDWQPGPGILNKVTLLASKIAFAWMKKLALIWWRRKD